MKFNKNKYALFKFHYLTGLIWLVAINVFSQNNPQAQNCFINQETQQCIDEWSIKSPDFEFHSSFKPYMTSTLKNYSDTSVGFLHHPVKNFFLSKTFNEGPDKRNQYNLQVLPLIDLQNGYDVLASKFISINDYFQKR